MPSDRIDEAVAAARGADGVLAVGGGSAIDLGKAISAATGLPLVSVPTTYAGAEWTTYFGVRDPERRMRGGGGGAHPVAIVYEPELTLELPAETTVGTAMNALAHCAEALYAQGHNPAADEHALAGARLIAEWLPRVVATPHDREARTELLRGAPPRRRRTRGLDARARRTRWRRRSAAATGSRTGRSTGSACRPCFASTRPSRPRPWRASARPSAIRSDPAGRVEALAALAGATRLRELGVPQGDLPGLAADAAGRGGNLANPKPASPDEIEQLLREVY